MVYAFDAATGRLRWEREAHTGAPFGGRHRKNTYASETPATDGDRRTELVVIGRQHAIAYAPDSGKELWRMKGLTGQSTPSPFAAAGLLYQATGSQGENNRPVFAVKPGASGDISLARGEQDNAFVAWVHPRASAYTSSPLVYRGRMYVVNDNGILTVFDAATGKEIYKARAGGSGNTFSASPWASDGKVYLLSEDGHTFVIEAGDNYVELATNSLDEMSLASPALAPGALFLRTQTRLYRIGRLP